MKVSLLFTLQTLCLLASCQPPRTAPAQVPATTTVSTLPTNPSWVIKRADDTDTGDDDSGDSNTADAATAEDSTETAEETTAEETTAETTAEETTASETSSAETTSETSSSSSSETSETSTSSSTSSSSSSSSSSSTSSSSPTSTISPEQAQRNHVGNIAAIATFSSLGFIILVVFLALAIRKRVLAKKKEEQQALLQAGSSAYSMVPAAAENPSANASEVRLSMMFANEPRVQEQTVHASPPFLVPGQGQGQQVGTRVSGQAGGSRLSQQYPAYI